MRSPETEPMQAPLTGTPVADPLGGRGSFKLDGVIGDLELLEKVVECRKLPSAFDERRSLRVLGFGGGRTRSSAVSSEVVVGQPTRLLWQVLTGAHLRLGFDCLGDGTPLKTTLTRIVGPTSKIDTLRVLSRPGV
jgi:hypothetical protein